MAGLDIARARRHALPCAIDRLSKCGPQGRGLRAGGPSHPADKPEPKSGADTRHGDQRRGGCPHLGGEVCGNGVGHKEERCRRRRDAQQDWQQDRSCPRAARKSGGHAFEADELGRRIHHGGTKLFQQREQGGACRQRLRIDGRGLRCGCRDPAIGQELETAGVGLVELGGHAGQFLLRPSQDLSRLRALLLEDLLRRALIELRVFFQLPVLIFPVAVDRRGETLPLRVELRAVGGGIGISFFDHRRVFAAGRIGFFCVFLLGGGDRRLRLLPRRRRLGLVFRRDFMLQPAPGSGSLTETGDLLTQEFAVVGFLAHSGRSGGGG